MSKVLVVGDTIIDHYVYGSVDRVNPEAPHSVVLDYMSESFCLGGAANVANNIKKLLPNCTVHYYGATSDMVSDMLTEQGICSSAEQTHSDDKILLKTRFVSSNHHLLRLDRNKKYNFSATFEDGLINLITENGDYDLIVMSDYDKGTINSQMSKKIFDTEIPVLFDVKKRKNLPFFHDSSACENVKLKANKQEFRQEVPVDVVFSVKAVVETRGHEGYFVHSNSNLFKSEPLDQIGVVDVVGAGDTFLAGMAVKFLQSKNFDPFELAHWGNKCAVNKVKHFGTHAVKFEDLLEDLNG